MPNVLKLSYLYDDIVNVNTLEVTDKSGVYDVDSNTGGYGDPNLDRNELALVSILREETVAGVVTISLPTVSWSGGLTNDTESIFTVPHTRDGYNRLFIIGIPIAADTVNGNIRYNTSNSTIEIYNNAWVALADNAELLTNTSLLRTECKILTLIRASKCLDYWSKKVLEYCDCNKDAQIPRENYRELKLRLQRAINSFNIGNYDYANEIIEKALTLYCDECEL